MLQFVGAASGGSDPLQPLATLARAARAAPRNRRAFTTVRSVAELDAALRGAGRPVMLDFYADWCVSCKEMERFTFSDAAVQQKLAGAVLLKADVTANNEARPGAAQALPACSARRARVLRRAGPRDPGSRVIGFQSSDRFLQTLRSVGL